MVKLVEFAKAVDKKMPFSPVDDCAIYMRNDPMFYRKHFFPAVIKMQEMYKKNQKVNASKCMGDCVNRGIESYCKEYKLGRSENIFKDEDKEALVKKLFSEEMKQIKDGAY
jgi:hypothetical protein